MTSGYEVIGIYVDIEGGHPEARWVTADQREAPTLTHELVDDICSGIDLTGIEEQSLAFIAAGEDLSEAMARRTLAAVKDALHDRVHDFLASGAGG